MISTPLNVLSKAFSSCRRSSNNFLLLLILYLNLSLNNIKSGWNRPQLLNLLNSFNFYSLYISLSRQIQFTCPASLNLTYKFNCINFNQNKIYLILKKIHYKLWITKEIQNSYTLLVLFSMIISISLWKIQQVKSRQSTSWCFSQWSSSYYHQNE